MREIRVSALARSKLRGQRSFPCLCRPPKPMPLAVMSQQGASPLPTEAGPPSHPPTSPRVRAFLVPGVFPWLSPGNGHGGSPGRKHWAAGAFAGHMVMETHRQKAAKKSEGHTGHRVWVGELCRCAPESWMSRPQRQEPMHHGPTGEEEAGPGAQSEPLGSCSFIIKGRSQAGGTGLSFTEHTGSRGAPRIS